MVCDVFDMCVGEARGAAERTLVHTGVGVVCLSDSATLEVGSVGDCGTAKDAG